LRSVWSTWITGRLAAAAGQAANPFVKDYKTLPGRYRDAAAFEHRPRREHACFTTSSAAYGAKKPTALDMPLLW
jgi:hypothetical protein